MILTRNDRIVPSLAIEDFEATTGQLISSHADEAAIFNPTASLLRSAELTEAQHGNVAVQEDEGASFIGGVEAKPLTAFVSVEAANQEGEELGLKFTEPPRRAALDIIKDRKRAEVARHNIMGRAGGGFVNGALGFATELAVSVIDPINLASAFVPIVGAGRSIQLARRFGKTGGRATKGIVEGTVGAALVEPVILRAAEQEQADYDFSNSLLNVAVGGVLGGGLHTSLGFAGDALRGRKLKRLRAQRAAGARESLEAREGVPDGETGRIIENSPLELRHATLRAAVAQAENGQRIDVDPMMDLMREFDARAVNEELAAASSDIEADADLGKMLDMIRDGKSFDADPAKLPTLRHLAQRGVDPDSPLGQELKRMGVTSQTMPGLFSRKKKAGQHERPHGAADNIPLSELDSVREPAPGRLGARSLDQIKKDAAAHQAENADEVALLNAIDDELREKAETGARSDEQLALDDLELGLIERGLDVNRMTNDEIAAAMQIGEDLGAVADELGPSRTQDDLDQLDIDEFGESTEIKRRAPDGPPGFEDIDPSEWLARFESQTTSPEAVAHANHAEAEAATQKVKEAPEADDHRSDLELETEALDDTVDALEARDPELGAVLRDEVEALKKDGDALIAAAELRAAHMQQFAACMGRG